MPWPWADFISSTVHGSFREADSVPRLQMETEAQGGTSTHRIPSLNAESGSRLFLASRHLPTSKYVRGLGQKGGELLSASWALGCNGSCRESLGWTHGGVSRMWGGVLAAACLKGICVVGWGPRTLAPGIQVNAARFQGLGRE